MSCKSKQYLFNGILVYNLQGWFTPIPNSCSILYGHCVLTDTKWKGGSNAFFGGRGGRWNWIIKLFESFWHIWSYLVNWLFFLEGWGGIVRVFKCFAIMIMFQCLLFQNYIRKINIPFWTHNTMYSYRLALFNMLFCIKVFFKEFRLVCC